MALFNFLRPKPLQRLAFEQYAALADHARHPAFYTEYGVPDTLGGRFDLLALHLVLLQRQIRNNGDDELAEALNKVFLADMDRGIREQGVGDVGVGKRVKTMTQGYLGRLLAYTQALDHPDDIPLRDVILRNVYACAEEDGADARIIESAERLCAYVRRAVAALADADLRKISCPPFPRP